MENAFSLKFNDICNYDSCYCYGFLFSYGVLFLKESFSTISVPFLRPSLGHTLNISLIVLNPCSHRII